MKQYLVTERWDDTNDSYHGWREVEREELPANEVLIIWPNGSSVALAPNARVLTREQVEDALFNAFLNASNSADVVQILNELFGGDDEQA